MKSAYVCTLGHAHACVESCAHLTGESGVSGRTIALFYLMCFLALFGRSAFLSHC